MPAVVYSDDLGPRGSLSDVRYAKLVGHAISDYWRWTGAPSAAAHLDEVVTEFGLSIRHPVISAGPVSVHIWVPRGCLSTFTYEFTVLSEDLGITHASGHREVAYYDSRTRSLAALDPEVWAHATPLLSPTYDDSESVASPGNGDTCRREPGARMRCRAMTRLPKRGGAE